MHPTAMQRPPLKTAAAEARQKEGEGLINGLSGRNILGGRDGGAVCYVKRDNLLLAKTNGLSIALLRKKRSKKRFFFLDIRGKDWIGEIEKGNPRACSSSSVSSGYGKRRNIYSDYKPISPKEIVWDRLHVWETTCNDGLWIFFRKGGGNRPWAEMVKSTCQNKCMCVSACREGKYLGNRWTFRKKFSGRLPFSQMFRKLLLDLKINGSWKCRFLMAPRVDN